MLITDIPTYKHLLKSLCYNMFVDTYYVYIPKYINSYIIYVLNALEESLPYLVETMRVEKHS